jgi:hypothetical protein
MLGSLEDLLFGVTGAVLQVDEVDGTEPSWYYRPRPPG